MDWFYIGLAYLGVLISIYAGYEKQIGFYVFFIVCSLVFLFIGVAL